MTFNPFGNAGTNNPFASSPGANFDELMKATAGAVKEARKKEAVTTLRERIRRCEELLTYAIALNQVSINTQPVGDEMEVDIAFIRSELSEWATELPEITTYQGIVSVVLQIKAYSIKNLNQILQKE